MPELQYLGCARGACRFGDGSYIICEANSVLRMTPPAFQSAPDSCDVQCLRALREAERTPLRPSAIMSGGVFFKQQARCSDSIRASSASRISRSYSSFSDIPIFRCNIVTALENRAVAASYSSRSRRFSMQPERPTGANDAIVECYDPATAEDNSWMS